MLARITVDEFLIRDIELDDPKHKSVFSNRGKMKPIELFYLLSAAKDRDEFIEILRSNRIKDSNDEFKNAALFANAHRDDEYYEEYEDYKEV